LPVDGGGLVRWGKHDVPPHCWKKFACNHDVEAGYLVYFFYKRGSHMSVKVKGDS
jgi:hypothetical protein